MRVTTKDDIINAMTTMDFDDVEGIKIMLGKGAARYFYFWERDIADNISTCLFELSLRRSISSVYYQNMMKKYGGRWIVIGTTERKDHSTNIDADIMLAILNMIDAGKDYYDKNYISPSDIHDILERGEIGEDYVPICSGINLDLFPDVGMP